MTNVIKRDGTIEKLNLDKIHKVLEWACEGLEGVSVSDIEMAAQLLIFDNIKTSDIHESLVKAASRLITAETPDYQYVASKLLNFSIRKNVYGSHIPDDLKTHVMKIVNLGFYDKLLLDKYSDRDFEQLNKHINHNRDYNIAYAGMEQFRGKYLVRNRVTGQILETPQMALMLISMALFAGYKKDRISWVKRLYDTLSTFKISFATPIMAGARTPQRQFSSCTVMEVGDSLDSISATVGAILKYVSMKAGIGVGAGAIRAEGSPIRNGDTLHTGNTRFYQLLQAATMSCSQGGVRAGKATIHYPFWHKEFVTLLNLKNNRGTEESSARHMDYSVQFSRLAYQRLLEGGNISLFCPSQVPGLYEAFFKSNEDFETLYLEAESNPSIARETISAEALFTQFMYERKSTGRIYFMNVDHCNTHSSFIPELAPIRTSNLCVTGDTLLNIEGADSPVRIDEVKIGNKVLSYNIPDQRNQYSTITNFAKTGTDRKVMRVTDKETGISVVCTPEHKIFTKNRGYVEAKDLDESDELLLVPEKF